MPAAPSEAPKSANKSITAGKAKETLSILSTAVPIIGAVGTLFVWLAANFYVGNVDIKPNCSYKSIAVQVFNQKGEESTFHTPHFQIMPGHYHCAVTVDENKIERSDLDVAFGKTSTVQVASAPQQMATQSETLDDSRTAGRKHWWQFWKKSQSSTADSESN